MIRNVLFLVIFVSLPIFGSAKVKISRDQARMLAATSEIDNQLQKSKIFQSLFVSIQKHQPQSPPICDPQGKSCVDSVCGRMPSYNCDDLSELKDIAGFCKGNYDGSCIDRACSKMPSYNCDDASELRSIAASCSGFYNSQCVDTVCSKMPSYNCDDWSELKEVIEVCKGN